MAGVAHIAGYALTCTTKDGIRISVSIQLGRV